MAWYHIMFTVAAVVMGLITAAAVVFLVRKVAREEAALKDDESTR
jgi:multisubunit Na+/H+ antiporter MnhE subunit